MKKETTNVLVILIYPLVFVLAFVLFSTRMPASLSKEAEAQLRENLKQEIKREMLEEFKESSVHFRDVWADSILVGVDTDHKENDEGVAITSNQFELHGKDYRIILSALSGNILVQSMHDKGEAIMGRFDTARLYGDTSPIGSFHAFNSKGERVVGVPQEND